jgi:hypothetical protein
VVKNHQSGVLQKKESKGKKDFVNGKRRAIRTSIVVTKEKQKGSYVKIFPHNFFFILLNTTNLFSNYLLMFSLSSIVRVQKLLIYNITILWGTFEPIDFSFGFFKIFFNVNHMSMWKL